MVDIILQEIASILIFFYAIGRFSRIIMRIEKSKLQFYTTKITQTPIRSTLFGIFSTALMQSHKAVSVITLTIINAGALSLVSAVPLLLSATIGASSTAFLVSMKWNSMEECLIILGAIIKKIKKHSNIGHIIFYLGLLLFGLELMANATSSLKDNQSFQKIFSFTDNIVILFSVGCILSILFQSGALVLSMLTILINYNAITMYNAICIATGVTAGAVLSLVVVLPGMNKEARMACYIDMLLILLCSIISLIFITPLTTLGDTYTSKAFGFAVANGISRCCISLASIIIFLIFSKTKFAHSFIQAKLYD